MIKSTSIILITALIWGMSSVQAQNWKLLGNAATVPASNFVGTTDNNPINFRTNNLTRMTIGANGFVGIGTSSPVSRLDIIGQLKITDGTQGTGKVLTSDANGLATWQTPSGGSADAWTRFGNAGIIDGTHFLGTTTNVPLNFRVNNQKAGRIDPLYYNVFMGYQAGNVNTIGDYNTAIGHQTLSSNTTGYANTAIGFRSLYVSTGALNTAVGVQALDANTTGNLNTAVGHHALHFNTSGGNNTAIGYYAGNNSGTVTSNFTAIGTTAGHVGSNSNTVEIGNTSVTWIGGQSGWFLYSDKRIKDNVRNNVPGLSFITKLNPVTYNLNIHRQNEICDIPIDDDWEGKYDIEKITQTGFLAQEVEAAAKACGYDFNGVKAPYGNAKLYSIQYASFVVPLVKAVQELEARNSALEMQYSELLNRLEFLESKNEIKRLNTAAGSLEQNAPNPFSEKTVIRYTLPASTRYAEMKLLTASGTEIQTIPLSSNGNERIEISGNTLEPGMYTYVLVADGKTIDSKQMVLTK